MPTLSRARLMRQNLVQATSFGYRDAKNLPPVVRQSLQSVFKILAAMIGNVAADFLDGPFDVCHARILAHMRFLGYRQAPRFAPGAGFASAASLRGRLTHHRAGPVVKVRLPRS
jgi:hypothetical protein